MDYNNYMMNYRPRKMLKESIKASIEIPRSNCENETNINVNSFDKSIKINDKIYLLSLNKNNNKILINCKLEDEDEELFSLDNYNIELSFEEFFNIGKIFKQCDDINQIFDLLYQILKTEIGLSNGMKSKSTLNIINYPFQGQSIELLLEVPLLICKYEKIKIELLNKKKDIKEQLNKIKEKYYALKNEINNYEEKIKNMSEEKGFAFEEN